MSKANWACLSNLSKQNPESQKATVEGVSDTNDSDWISMPEMDEISDSEAEDSDDESENTTREPRREKHLFHVVDYNSGNESDWEEEGSEGDDEIWMQWKKMCLHAFMQYHCFKFIGG